jgi:hypothetical protein
VPTFDRRAKSRSVSRLHVENDARLAGHRSIELGPTDQAEIDEGLAKAFTRLGLRPERVVDFGSVDRALVDEHRPQQGSIAAVVVHVLPPCDVVPRCPLCELRAAHPRMICDEEKWNPSIK